MEQKLLFLINREWTSPALDRLMAAMSSFDVWAIPLVILVVLLFVFGGFKRRAMLIVLGMTVGFSDGVVAAALKTIVNRPRPHEVLANVRRVDLARAKPRLLALFRDVKTEMSRPRPTSPAAGRSLPSSHTMNNFCAAMVVTLFYGRFGLPLFAVAGLVGYSRIYVGAHWPSDIALSIVLACGVALLVVALAEWLWKRIGAKAWPQFTLAHPSLLASASA